MARRKFSGEVPTNVINLNNGSAVNITSVELFGRRLAAYRKKAGLKQGELGDALGLSNNAISMWENGKARPDIEHIVPLCRALKITPSQLFGVLSGVTRQELDVVESYRELWPVNREIIDSTIRMLKDMQDRTRDYRPLLALEQSPNELSAGSGVYTVSDEKLEPLWVHDTPMTRRAGYVFTVNGDSMEPAYHDRDKVLVERSEFNALRPGTVAAFRADNDLYIKEFRPGELRSLNPEYRSYPMDSFGEVYLLGRVIGVLSKEDIATEEELRAWTAMRGN